MVAPINTYDSQTNLSLGQIPDVEDEVLYKELLDIHNAIESLLKGSDNANAIFAAYIAKQRNITVVTSTPYSVTADDGLILVDLTTLDINVILPTGEEFSGYSYEIKTFATAPTTKECLVTAVGAAPIDDDAGGITIDAIFGDGGEALPVKYDFDNNAYWINN